MSSTTWTSHPVPVSSFWRTARWLLVGLVLCRGVVLLCLMPPFEAWDEYQHVGYVEHIVETGQAAVLGKTFVPQDFLEEALKLPQPALAVAHPLGPLGGVGYDSYWNDPSSAHYRGGTTLLYQAQHSAFSYRLAAPIFRAFGGVKNLRASVAALRFANLLLTAGAVWIALGAFRKVVTREADAALLGLVLAAHPLFLMNGTRVANDALGVFVGVSAVASGLALMVSDGRRLNWHGLGVGLLVGLAAWAKATNLGLLPFLGFAWLAVSVRQKLGFANAIWLGVVMLGGCLAIVQFDLVFNYRHYGFLTSMQEAIINHKKGLTRLDMIRAARKIPWFRIVTHLWDRELYFTGGWSFLRTHPELTRVYQKLLTLGLLGWGWIAITRGMRLKRDNVFTSAWVPAACLVVVAGYTLALGYHRVQSTLAWGIATTNAWYACPALPWFLAVVSAGGLAWPLGKWFRPVVPIALAAACIGGEIVGLSGMMLDTYSGHASTTGEALRRIAALQPRAFGTATLVGAIVGQIVLMGWLLLAWRDGVRMSPSRSLVPEPRDPHHVHTRHEQDARRMADLAEDCR